MGNKSNGMKIIERERGGDSANKALSKILVENYNDMMPLYDGMSDS